MQRVCRLLLLCCIHLIGWDSTVFVDAVSDCAHSCRGYASATEASQASCKCDGLMVSVKILCFSQSVVCCLQRCRVWCGSAVSRVRDNSDDCAVLVPCFM
jgi:hypothetical protein